MINEVRGTPSGLTFKQTRIVSITVITILVDPIATGLVPEKLSNITIDKQTYNANRTIIPTNINI